MDFTVSRLYSYFRVDLSPRFSFIDENQALNLTTETGNAGYELGEACRGKRSYEGEPLNTSERKLSSFSRAEATTWGRLRLRAAESTYLVLGVYSRARKCAIRGGRPGWRAGSMRK